jgi:hypothetical protein
MPCSTNIGAHGQQRKSVLLRRCYLSPHCGRNRYRKNFTQTAFSVVDCPTLAQGKNSADIHMVIDILDTLEHRTYFDKFIIFSGDSDFTPVLLRLRAHNRRTTILTIRDDAVVAYKAAADRVIDGKTFRTDAINFDICQHKPSLVSTTPMPVDNGVG